LRVVDYMLTISIPDMYILKFWGGEFEGSDSVCWMKVVRAIPIHLFRHLGVICRPYRLAQRNGQTDRQTDRYRHIRIFISPSGSKKTNKIKATYANSSSQSYFVHYTAITCMLYTPLRTILL